MMHTIFTKKLMDKDSIHGWRNLIHGGLLRMGITDEGHGQSIFNFQLTLQSVLLSWAYLSAFIRASFNLICLHYLLC